MTPTERAFHREQSRYMALAGCALSGAAHTWVESLVATVSANLDGQCRPSTLRKLRVALEAFVADLFAVEAAGKWARRSLDNVSFTGQRVSRRMFVKVRDALADRGLLEWFKGFRVREFNRELGRETHWGGQSCFRGTAALFETATKHGVELEHWPEHFTVGRPLRPSNCPLVSVRGASRRNVDGTKQRGKLLLDRTSQPQASEIARDILELNEFLDGQRVEGFAFAGLRRVFSNGDVPGFNWQWGGRFYSLPNGDAYEQWKGGSEARISSIRLGGERVCEVDISACHLTLVYGLAAEPFDWTRDPYDLPPHSRDAVKRYITAALGHGNVAPRGRWYSRVRETVLQHHPVLVEIERLGIGSLDLQFHESEILLRAMRELRDKHSLASLPIHDGLIVPESARETTRAVLSDVFGDYFRHALGRHEGINPRIP